MALQSMVVALSALAAFELADASTVAGGACAADEERCEKGEAEEAEEAALLQAHGPGFGTWRWKRAPPRSALMVIDMQYDFINGTLPVPDAKSIIPTVNSLTALPGWHAVIFTRDYHAFNHISFAANHEGADAFSSVDLGYTEDLQLCTKEGYTDPNSVECSEGGARWSLDQTLWPTHCVQNTVGGKISADVRIPAKSMEVLKGITTSVDSYGAFVNNLNFDETNTEQLLRSRHVKNVYVVGLAKDYCVKYTALQAETLKFKTYVVLDATRAVAEDTGADAETEMAQAGVTFIDSAELLEHVAPK